MRRDRYKKLEYSIKNNTLNITLANNSEEIDINKIKAIDISLIGLGEYQIILNSDEYISISCSLMKNQEAKDLFEKLKETNPDIRIEKNIKKVLYSGRGLKLDFSTEENILVRDKISRIKNPALDSILGFSSVLILIAVVALPIIFVPKIFYTNITLRTILFCIGSFSFGFALINMIAALVSAYLGHTVTKVSVIIGMVFFIFGVIV